MSKTAKKNNNATEPAQPKKAASSQELLTIVATQLEELRAEVQGQAKNTNLLAEAIVKINEKVEAKAAGGEGGGSDAITKVLTQILAGEKGTSLEVFAKQAESFARAADALDHFRHPSRIGVGEATLMRLGLRAAYPRYMTKAELAKAERSIGITSAFEGEEGETEHVSE